MSIDQKIVRLRETAARKVASPRPPPKGDQPHPPAKVGDLPLNLFKNERF